MTYALSTTTWRPISDSHPFHMLTFWIEVFTLSHSNIPTAVIFKREKGIHRISGKSVQFIASVHWKSQNTNFIRTSIIWHILNTHWSKIQAPNFLVGTNFVLHRLSCCKTFLQSQNSAHESQWSSTSYVTKYRRQNSPVTCLLTTSPTRIRTMHNCNTRSLALPIAPSNTSTTQLPLLSSPSKLDLSTKNYLILFTPWIKMSDITHTMKTKYGLKVLVVLIPYHHFEFWGSTNVKFRLSTIPICNLQTK